MNEFELIENYLKGKLQGQELVEFENKLASNSAFSSKVEEHKAMQELLHTQGLIQTREKLQALRKERLSKDNKKGNGHNGWIKSVIFILLSLVVLTSVYLFFNQSKSSNDSNTFFTSSPEGNPLSDSTISALDNKENTSATIISNSIDSIKTDKTLSVTDITDKDSVWQNMTTTSSTDTHSVKPTDKKNIASQKVIPPEIVKDACDEVHIKAKIQTDASCEDKTTGKLVLSQLTGGKAPYIFSLDNVESGRSGFFDQLPAGKHEVQITDANGCTTLLQAEIQSKPCQLNIFAPDYGETWKFPISTNGNCKVSIYDSSGKMVYEVTTNNGQPSEWNGVGNNEAYIKAGAYLYQISCDDGKINQGSVTVTR
jgi:hypothetical protein